MSSRGQAVVVCRRKGQAMVEFALVGGILIAMLTGILEVGRLMFIDAELQNAASEGANYAALHKPCTNQQGQTFLQQVTNATEAKLVLTDKRNVSVDPPTVPSCAHCPIQITVHAAWTSVLPFIGRGNIVKSSHKLIEYNPDGLCP